MLLQAVWDSHYQEEHHMNMQVITVQFLDVLMSLLLTITQMLQKTMVLVFQVVLISFGH